MLRSLAWALLWLLVSQPLALADDGDAATLDTSKVPKQATRLEQFAPPGWRIAQKYVGNLDSDPYPDAVLFLIESNGKKPEEPRGRGMAVVVKKGDLYRLVGVSARTLLCTTCGGMLSNPADDSVDFTVKNKVIIIKQLWGSREACDSTLRYRIDPTGRVALIGADFDHYDRGSGESEIMSTNYLTGDRTILRRQMHEKGPDTVLKRQQIKIKPRKIYIEDVDPQMLAEATK